MEIWKNATCGKCGFSEEMPRPSGSVPDLKAPKILMCRKNPPQIVYAIAQGRDGRPNPVPMGSMYPMIDEAFIACSDFKLKVKEGTTVVGSMGLYNPSLGSKDAV